MHKWTVNGKLFAWPKETYASYDPDANEIQIVSDFSPREKFVSLLHEMEHYLIHQLPEHLWRPLDDGLHKVTLLSQRIRLFSLPTAEKRDKYWRSRARRLSG